MTEHRSPAEVLQRFCRPGEGRVATNSEQWLMELVRRSGTISRADLTRASGLSVPGAKGLIDGLVERGILVLGPAITKGRGQPSASVSLQATHAYAIGLSIMVDGFSVVIMDLSGRLVGAREVHAFPMELDFVACELSRLVPNMLSEYAIPQEDVFGVGLSMTGPLTGVGSRVNPPLSLGAQWAEAELDRFFGNVLKLPVWIDNDANCAALAELLFGVGNRIDDFVYLHFTDGFAAGLVTSGKVLRGANGNAGELGRLLTVAGLPRPSLETLRLRLVAASVELPDIGSLLQHYDPAWPQIEEWITDIRGSLSVAIAAATALIDPRAVVFGSRLPQDLAQRLIAAVEIEKHPRRGIQSPLPELLIHSVQDYATSIGAAALPFKAHFFA